MNWIWKLLGYVDEDKELIKKYQLETAKEYYKDKNLSLKQKEQLEKYPVRIDEQIEKLIEDLSQQKEFKNKKK